MSTSSDTVMGNTHHYENILYELKELRELQELYKKLSTDVSKTLQELKTVLPSIQSSVD